MFYLNLKWCQKIEHMWQQLVHLISLWYDADAKGVRVVLPETCVNCPWLSFQKKDLKVEVSSSLIERDLKINNIHLFHELDCQKNLMELRVESETINILEEWHFNNLFDAKNTSVVSKFTALKQIP